MQKQGKNSKKEHVPITQCQQWSRSASSQISSQFSNFHKCHAKCMLSQLSRVWLFGTLKPTRLLCPWDSPEKNTGVGCHVLLQGIFPTQGSNLCLLQLLHWAGEFFTTSTTREALMSHNFSFLQLSCLNQHPDYLLRLVSVSPESLPGSGDPPFRTATIQELEVTLGSLVIQSSSQMCRDCFIPALRPNFLF